MELGLSRQGAAVARHRARSGRGGTVWKCRVAGTSPRHICIMLSHSSSGINSHSYPASALIALTATIPSLYLFYLDIFLLRSIPPPHAQDSRIIRSCDRVSYSTRARKPRIYPRWKDGWLGARVSPYFLLISLITTLYLTHLYSYRLFSLRTTNSLAASGGLGQLGMRRGSTRRRVWATPWQRCSGQHVSLSRLCACPGWFDVQWCGVAQGHFHFSIFSTDSLPYLHVCKRLSRCYGLW
ncbi:hypothetical protein B0H17DRAFT_212175 [Mycena rosella]|uniref:Uncharacterized protein n=1 Tax=Mycena rosella TaxID=1033263 RepID=A0AAD7DWG4_MYCRO|nr:hypothetical protein B0H17DRAFT_212175 [Mycena rosella]